jgi:ferrous iron transport protein B
MHCHDTQPDFEISPGGSIALVGHPNVGKSAIFQRLTGQHVAISNYPGTTVEVIRGPARDLPETIVVDTPGVIAFPPHSEDEVVTEQVLFSEHLKAILQVGDAKNIRRTLLLSVQLAEMGVPLILALNMMDEANTRGVLINDQLLSENLSIPIIPTTAVRGTGLNELTKSLQKARIPKFRLHYPDKIDAVVSDISTRMTDTPISSRAIALLWLSGDMVTDRWLQQNVAAETYRYFVNQRDQLQLSYVEPVSVVIQKVRLNYVEKLADQVILAAGSNRQGWSSWLGHRITQPFWGTLTLVGVLYALYLFVGVFGAGTLVDWLEIHLFGEIINPWMIDWVSRLVPFPLLADFLVGEYGLWTMGMTYALALILPIVSTFFLAFGIMEDSGYLPRLAVLSNRLFRTLGLNGKAVLPMVLGLGCVTMADDARLGKQAGTPAGNAAVGAGHTVFSPVGCGYGSVGWNFPVCHPDLGKRGIPCFVGSRVAVCPSDPWGTNTALGGAAANAPANVFQCDDENAGSSGVVYQRSGPAIFDRHSTDVHLG